MRTTLQFELERRSDGSSLDPVNLRSVLSGVHNALSGMGSWDRAAHVFWLLGPFILLIERSPADIWLSVIVLVFVGRAIMRREGWWLATGWVRFGFLFWFVCILSGAVSSLPLYSVGEVIAWFRFPLFAMAVVFWLGRDSRLVYGMILSIAVAMMMMTAILAAELLIVGQTYGRLTWPYGDLVPGNFLAKACLPASVVGVALVTSAGRGIAGLSAKMILFSMAASLMTGERINFLIRLCSSIIAAVAWRPKALRLTGLVVVFAGSFAALLLFVPGLAMRFIGYFITQLPNHAESGYYKAMMPGWLAFEQSPITGIGPGNLRMLCPQITGGSPAYACHPHPHNYFLQMAGEAGIIGLVTGTLFLGSIVWACARPALRNRENVVVATMWIVPFAFFWPIASTADFFGQWNNVFMWSAVAVALAGARIDARGEVVPKG